MKIISYILACCLVLALCNLGSCDDTEIYAFQAPDSSNDGGFTTAELGQTAPTSNDGGFTDQWSSGWTVIDNSGYNQQAPGSSWGQQGGGDSWGQATGNPYATQKPMDFGQLVETGAQQAYAPMPSGGQFGPNTFWIVDVTGLNRYPSMSIPLYGYAREEIIPSMDGILTIDEMYPNGEVRTFNMGYVRAYYTYKMWFYGDQPGTHLVRYNVNGYYSNTIRFYVQGSRPSTFSAGTGTSTTYSGGSGMVSRSGTTVIRGSGGSMSVSMSSF